MDRLVPLQYAEFGVKHENCKREKLEGPEENGKDAAICRHQGYKKFTASVRGYRKFRVLPKFADTDGHHREPVCDEEERHGDQKVNGRITSLPRLAYQLEMRVPESQAEGDVNK